jgi:type II secretory pathway predicted ATPase ExeA
MMLSGRPLLPSVDQRYLVDRPEAAVVVRAVERKLNTLVLADRGMGKTTLLRDVEARVEAQLGMPVVYLDGRRLTDAAPILLAVRDALSGPRAPMSDSLRMAALPFTPVPVEVRNEQALRVVRDLVATGERACVLLDDPEVDAVHRLFGRLRDELWQTELAWVVAGDALHRQQYLTPPADAFFERIVELAPLTDRQQEQLIRKRLDRGEDRELVGVRVENGNPRTLLVTLREATSAADAATLLARRAERQQRVGETLGRVASMMLAEIEDGAVASASDTAWLDRFGVSRQRAQQVLSALERAGHVRAERLPGPGGRPRKVYRRLESGA